MHPGEWLMHAAPRSQNHPKPVELDLGVSENGVPLHPMVLLIIIPITWLFHWEYTLFSDKPISSLLTMTMTEPMMNWWLGGERNVAKAEQ